MLKATFQSLLVSLLLSLALVNAIPVPQSTQDMGTADQDIIAELCEGLPNGLGSILPGCTSSTAAQPVSGAAQKRQIVPPDFLNMPCKPIISKIPGLSTIFRGPVSSIPVPPVPAERRRQFDNTDLDDICSSLPGPVASRLGCPPTNSAPATQKRQLSSGLLGALGAAPGVQPVEGSTAAPEARQSLPPLDISVLLAGDPHLLTIELSDEDVDD